MTRADFPCRECGAPGETIRGAPWFADNDLWNEVNGSPNGFMCPTCFTAKAEAMGIILGWRAGRIGTL